MAETKPSFTRDDEAHFRNKFPRIPQTPEEVTEYIAARKTARRPAGTPPFDEAGAKKFAANYFWGLAKAVDAELGIREQPGGRPNGYNHQDKRDVMRHLQQASFALGAAEGENVPELFFGGAMRTFFMEGIAMEGKQASHFDTKKRYGGISQIGAEAFFEAWLAGAQKLANGIAMNLGDPAHPFYHKTLTGERFWQNARAVHVQLATLYKHMKPDLQRLARLSEDKMDYYQKLNFIPLLNNIPALARNIIRRLEGKETLADIKLAALGQDMKRLVGYNPRIWVKDSYMREELPGPLYKKIPGRLHNLKGNLGDVLADVGRNLQSDFTHLTSKYGVKKPDSGGVRHRPRHPCHPNRCCALP